MSIVAWLKGLKRRRLDDTDLDEEIRAHLAIAADERMADGADRRSAELASRKDFGNVLLTTEAARRVWTPWWLEALHDQVSDVRYAIRSLAKNPAFSVAVVGVLTLGIGLNAAVFTMVKSIALTPLAGVDGSARLGVVYGETSAGREVNLSYPDYKYIRDHDRAFSGLLGTAFITESVALQCLNDGNCGGIRDAKHVNVRRADSHLFEHLLRRAIHTHPLQMALEFERARCLGAAEAMDECISFAKISRSLISCNNQRGSAGIIHRNIGFTQRPENVLLIQIFLHRKWSDGRGNRIQSRVTARI